MMERSGADRDDVTVYNPRGSQSVILFAYLPPFPPQKHGETDVQLILPPPPRHCPHGTSAERSPSAALGRPACTRTVREPGARCDK